MCCGHILGFEVVEWHILHIEVVVWICCLKRRNDVVEGLFLGGVKRIGVPDCQAVRARAIVFDSS